MNLDLLGNWINRMFQYLVLITFLILRIFWAELSRGKLNSLQGIKYDSLTTVCFYFILG